MKTRGRKKSEDMEPEDAVPEGDLFVISTKPSEVQENDDVEPEIGESQGLLSKETIFVCRLRWGLFHSIKIAFVTFIYHQILLKLAKSGCNE